MPFGRTMTMTERERPRNDDEWLSALIDGELAPDDEAKLRARLDREPELAARLESMRSADGALRAALDAGRDDPMPAGVMALLQSDDKVVSLQRPDPRRFFDLPLAMAASAALAVGFVLAQLWPLQTGPEGGAERLLGASLIEEGTSLHAAVSTLPSGESARVDGAALTPRLTFRDAAGVPCRVVDLAGDELLTEVVVCRDGSDWRVRMAGYGPPRDAVAGDFQPAFGDRSAVDRALDALIADAPLGRDEERALLERDWVSE